MGNLAINGGAQIDALLDQNGNKVLDILESSGLIINYLTLGGNVASNAPFLAAAGADTNLHLILNGKGTGAPQFNSSTAITAGGALGCSMGSSFTGIYFGSGVPTISAPQGSIYLRSDGSSTSTRLYVNANGATTWTNVTTAT